ncbi:MAG: FtsX-like permease family protein [Nitrolancea sp.]
MARASAKPQTSQFKGAPSLVTGVLRRLRVERPQAGAMMAMILVTTLIFAAVPRLFNEVADRGLRYSVTNAAVYERNLVMTRGGRVTPGPANDVFAPIEQQAVQFQNGLAPSIQSVIDHHVFVVDASRYQFVDGAGTSFLRYVTMRYQQNMNDHITLVQGRMPDHTDATFTTTGKSPQQLMVVEIAISQPTADALRVKLGDTIPMQPDTDDRLTRVPNGEGLKDLAMRVVGIISVPNPDDDYWYSLPAIDKAAIADDGNSTRVYATAIFAPSEYADILQDTTPGLLGYTFRYYVNPSRFNAGIFDTLAPDMRRLDAQYGSQFSGPPTSTAVASQLTKILNQFAEQRRLTISILSLGVIGLLVIAMATIGLVAAFIAENRRDSIRLLRGRGASAWQIISTQAVEGLLLGIPAAIIGVAIATLFVDSRTSMLSYYAAAGIVILTIILLITALWPLARRGLGMLERDDVPISKTSPRRVAIEIFVVVIAGLGIYLLRRRGLAAGSTDSALGGFDPYLAAVPVLLGLATGLVVLRLYSLPIRLLAWNASYRSDLVPFLGFRRVARQSGAAAVPLLVILLSIAISVFSSVMMHSIDVGQVNTSWKTVGADYRLDTAGPTSIPNDFTLESVPGIKNTAAASLQQNLVVASNQPLFGTFNLLAIDTTAYEKVVKGTPVDPFLNADLLSQPTGTDVGTPKSPIPVVVSSSWITGSVPKRGDHFSVLFGQQPVAFVISDIRDRFVGVSTTSPFAIVSLPSLESILGARNVEPTTLFVSAPESSKQAIKDAIDTQYAPVTLVSRADQYAKVHDSPLISGAARGFEVGIGLSAAYSALAVVIALALSNRSRIRDLTYLRTLGLSRRQVLMLTITEQAPPVVLALVIGTGLGIGVARLIKPGLDLTAFTGEGFPAPLMTDWFAIFLLIGGIILAVAVAIAIVSASAQRANVSGVLRMGEE